MKQITIILIIAFFLITLSSCTQGLNNDEKRNIAKLVLDSTIVGNYFNDTLGYLCIDYSQLADTSEINLRDYYQTKYKDCEILIMKWEQLRIWDQNWIPYEFISGEYVGIDKVEIVNKQEIVIETTWLRASDCSLGYRIELQKVNDNWKVIKKEMTRIS